MDAKVMTLNRPCWRQETRKPQFLVVTMIGRLTHWSPEQTITPETKIPNQ